ASAEKFGKKERIARRSARKSDPRISDVYASGEFAGAVIFTTAERGESSASGTGTGKCGAGSQPGRERASAELSGKGIGAAALWSFGGKFRRRNSNLESRSTEIVGGSRRVAGRHYS